MKVAFIIPSTTHKRDWKSSEETLLWTVLCSSLEKNTPHHQIKLFIGFDCDDRIYSVPEERMKFSAVFMNFDIEWFSQGIETKGKPTWIWNDLGEKAMHQGYEYMKVLGDDIKMPNDTGWLGCFINKLHKKENIGFCSGWSNNDNIPTQFLIHKTHINIFGFIYPNEIPNWGCDDWMYRIYPAKYRQWIKSYPLYNVGGAPRYEIPFSENFVKAIIKRYKPKFNRFISEKNK